MQQMVFTKHLDDMSFDQMGAALAEAGIGAVDLTVRPGGHVEPEAAADQLPAAQEALRAHGIAIGMLTTEIKSADDPSTRATLETAAALGIRHYKLGYWKYAGFGSLARTREEVVAALKPLAAMNEQLGVTAGYHNHSAAFFGACLSDVADVLDRVDSPRVGAYYDAAHATIEGGSRGWLMGLERVIDRLVMLAVKDFRWRDDQAALPTGRRHSLEMCPLADGNTLWPEALGHLREAGFDGPTSFHSEYRSEYSFRYLSVPELIAQTRSDMDQFNRWWARATAPQPARA